MRTSYVLFTITSSRSSLLRRCVALATVLGLTAPGCETDSEPAHGENQPSDASDRESLVTPALPNRELGEVPPTNLEEAFAPTADLHEEPVGRFERTHYAVAPSCVTRDLHLTYWPLAGVNGKDYMVNNYVDLNTSATLLRDYRGFTGALARTYDGHRGIDVDIPSFREMDDNSAVVRAASGGEVVALEQAQPDRNQTSSSPTGWNFVQIEAENGFQIFYGHLKRDSVRVNVGDIVAPGDALGIAGSSGNSTQPHLHLEVVDCTGRAVDSHLFGLWASPVAYTPSSAVMDVMLRQGAFTDKSQIINPVPNIRSIRVGSTLGIGLSATTRGGDVFDLKLIRPDGSNIAWTWTNAGNARTQHGFLWWPQVIDNVVGTWTFEVRVNGGAPTRRTFGVSTVAAGRPEQTRHGLSSASFSSTMTDLLAADYHPVWLQSHAVTVDGVAQTTSNAIFRPYDGYDWRYLANVSPENFWGYAQPWTSQEGYHMVDIETFTAAGETRMNAVFTTNPIAANHEFFFNRTESAFLDLVNANRARGMSLIRLTASTRNGALNFAGIFAPQAGSFTEVAYTRIAVADYQTIFNSEAAQGRNLKALDHYKIGARGYFVAVFNSKPIQTSARHNLSASAFQAARDQLVNGGLWTRAIVSYDNGGSKFAGIWTP
jgi:murein DD-endopeptidase MepM/ murein hydrolase activator NlpD